MESVSIEASDKIHVLNIWMSDSSPLDPDP